MMNTILANEIIMYLQPLIYTSEMRSHLAILYRFDQGISIPSCVLHTINNYNRDKNRCVEFMQHNNSF